MAGLLPSPSPTLLKEKGLGKRPHFFSFFQSCKGESVRTATAGLQEHCICLDDEKPGKRMRKREAFLPEPSSMRGGVK